MFPSFSFCDHNVETLVRVVGFTQVVPGFLERTFGIFVEVPSSLEKNLIGDTDTSFMSVCERSEGLL